MNTTNSPNAIAIGAALRLVRADEQPRRTPTESAAEIRRAIKAAVRSRALPVAIYSVRTRYASQMVAIEITVTDAPFCAYEIGPFVHGLRSVQMTAEAHALDAALRAMALDAGYEATGRHSFLHVEIDSDERGALFAFVEAERSGEIARAVRS